MYSNGDHLNVECDRISADSIQFSGATILLPSHLTDLYITLE
ncbi:hypothetical protein XM38_000770 [Halomicronema hongdechloris C2206]|uniref:Uncharacterized protein n=1 Tax=Halomicronema hongdechloris C2206 TaxID=1641165 RepID=A0A1Z3HFX5_9CYAN|nr:hypothetical protein XM38_000770 [Halomicronema hongdechloris C2206]